jgi:hypothetical protein
MNRYCTRHTFRGSSRATARNLKSESLSEIQNDCLKFGILLRCNTIPDNTDAMSIDLIEGFRWVVERPRPEDDVVVSDVCASSRDGAEQLIRVVGLDACDYLNAREALALARALAAAVNELLGAAAGLITAPVMWMNHSHPTRGDDHTRAPAKTRQGASGRWESRTARTAQPPP